MCLSVPAERNGELRGNECIWLRVPVWKYSKNYQCGQRYTKHRRNKLNGLFFVVALARVKWNNVILLFCSVEFSVIEAIEGLKVQWKFVVDFNLTTISDLWFYSHFFYCESKVTVFIKWWIYRFVLNLYKLRFLAPRHVLCSNCDMHLLAMMS